MNKLQIGVIALYVVVSVLVVYFIVKLANGLELPIYGFLGGVAIILILLFILIGLADLYDYAFGGDENEYNGL